MRTFVRTRRGAALIGGLVLPALLALLMFIPSIGLMIFVERHAAAPPR